MNDRFQWILSIQTVSSIVSWKSLSYINYLISLLCSNFYLHNLNSRTWFVNRLRRTGGRLCCVMLRINQYFHMKAYPLDMFIQYGTQQRIRLWTSDRRQLKRESYPKHTCCRNMYTHSASIVRIQHCKLCKQQEEDFFFHMLLCCPLLREVRVES